MHARDDGGLGRGGRKELGSDGKRGRGGRRSAPMYSLLLRRVLRFTILALSGSGSGSSPTRRCCVISLAEIVDINMHEGVMSLFSSEATLRDRFRCSVETLTELDGRVIFRFVFRLTLSVYEETGYISLNMRVFYVNHMGIKHLIMFKMDHAV
jgi:hypothetical protein